MFTGLSFGSLSLIKIFVICRMAMISWSGKMPWWNMPLMPGGPGWWLLLHYWITLSSTGCHFRMASSHRKWPSMGHFQNFSTTCVEVSCWGRPWSLVHTQLIKKYFWFRCRLDLILCRDLQDRSYPWWGLDTVSAWCRFSGRSFPRWDSSWVGRAHRKCLRFWRYCWVSGC